MTRATHPPEFADDLRVSPGTLRALSHALELALPHLPSGVLREISAALDSGVRFVPEGRQPSTMQPSTVESELNAVWAALNREPPR